MGGLIRGREAGLAQGRDRRLGWSGVEIAEKQFGIGWTFAMGDVGGPPEDCLHLTRACGHAGRIVGMVEVGVRHSDERSAPGSDVDRLDDPQVGEAQLPRGDDRFCVPGNQRDDAVPVARIAGSLRLGCADDGIPPIRYERRERSVPIVGAVDLLEPDDVGVQVPQRGTRQGQPGRPAIALRVIQGVERYNP